MYIQEEKKMLSSRAEPAESVKNGKSSPSLTSAMKEEQQ